MKAINEMSKEELLQRCLEKRQNGTTLHQLSNMFEHNQVDIEKRKYVIDNIDNVPLKVDHKAELVKEKNKGLNLIIAGLIVLFAGALMITAYKTLTEVIFNVIRIGLLLLIAGIFSYFVFKKKKKKKR